MDKDDKIIDYIDLPSITLGDYFAAAALTGLLSDRQARGTCNDLAVNAHHLAELAYIYADAMLNERAK